MIVFDLECRGGGHRFEGWFGSSDDFARQQERGLVTCPKCGSMHVVKAPMAPHLGRKGNQVALLETPSLPVPAHPAPLSRPAMAATARPPALDAVPAPTIAQPPQPISLPPEALAMLQGFARMQAEALKSSRWVGDNFAEDARAMHYGEVDHATIHGRATPEEARDLFEEGIEIAPILFPIAGPGKIN